VLVFKLNQTGELGVRYSSFAGIAIVILLAISPAAGAVRDEGILLSSDDYVFLAAQGIQRDNAILQKLSPKELRGLHHLINDQRAQSDPQSKAVAVTKALGEFEDNQRWETANPGRLWNEQKTPVTRRTRPD
jgi:hypothetical protein